MLYLNDNVKTLSGKKRLPFKEFKIMKKKFKVFFRGRFVQLKKLSKFRHKVNKDIFFKSKIMKKIKRMYFRRRYTYRIDIRDPQPKKPRYIKRILSLRLIRLFYVIISFKLFRLIAKKARRKPGLVEENHLYLLEGRAASIIYRSSFVLSMFEAIVFSKLGLLQLDGIILIKSVFKLIPIMKLIFLAPLLKGNIWWSLARRLNRPSFLGFPKHIYISKFFLWFVIKFYPRRVKLLNPIRHLDIFRVTNYIR